MTLTAPARAHWRLALSMLLAGVLTIALITFWPRPSDSPAAAPATPSPSPSPTATAPPSPSPSPSPSPTPPPSPSPTVVAAPHAPTTLPVLDYFKTPPAGFPADPTPMSSKLLTQALHPTKKIAVYTAPGGRPLAYAAPTISGVPLVMPIVAQKQGWRAVLLPSVNRTIGWVPPTGWTTVALRDQLVVHLSTHQLTWLRDGTPQYTWTVAVGAKSTPTPRGRTFVLARTSAHSKVYAGVDVLALGAIPGQPGTVAPSRVDAHTGIHAWYDSSVFGKNVSNGCVRIPKAAQQTLLAEIVAGTGVLIVD